MGMIFRAADNLNPDSMASGFRRQRLNLFFRLFYRDAPLSILDLGGTPAFWAPHLEQLPSGSSVTVVNLQPGADPAGERILHHTGDGRDLREFADRTFDVCFSNSTIEHAGTATDQAAMASEIRRVADGYFVQTPNYLFPLEPHFLVPFWQFLPVSFRTWLHRRSDLGWMRREPDLQKAREAVTSIRLLSAKKFQGLFPDAQIHQERFGPLTKALIAYRTLSPC